jgi:hypothetical protein
MVKRKLFAFRTDRLKLDNLAGLCTEIVDLAIPIVSTLEQPLLTVTLDTLNSDVNTLLSLMNRSRASTLTPVLQILDGNIGSLFAEVKRMTKACIKSSNTAKAAAATLLMQTIKPYWNVTDQRLITQLVQLEELGLRVASSGELLEALSVLGLMDTWQKLIGANDEFNILYEQRTSEQADTAHHAASSIKATVVKDYDGFRTAIEQTLMVFPSPPVELLFKEVNEMCKKYAPLHRIKLTAANATTEPVPMQHYNGGKPVTPLPQISLRTTPEPVELKFSVDYTVTYRNNVNVGEAMLIIRGKGKYAGKYITKFHII